MRAILGRSSALHILLVMLLSAPMILVPAAAMAAPANDNYPGTTISGASGSIFGTTFDASIEDGEWFDESDDRSVWYTWTAPASGVLTADTCALSVAGHLLALYSDHPFTSDPIAESPQACSTSNGFILTSAVTSGTTYWL